ncbi:MAG: adenylate/guanylate cyclase domain-containing protein [Thiolinea sp.]
MKNIIPKKPKTAKKREGLSLRSKFLFVLLGSAIACTLITAYQSLRLSQQELDNGMIRHLESLRNGRLDQIEHYFEEKRAELSVFSKDPLVIDAMHEFNAASALLKHYNIGVKPEESAQLSSHYKKKLLTPLKNVTNEVKIIDHFMPKSDAARYLQYHYIAQNPAPTGNKHLLDAAKDGSYYSDLHQKYHANFLHVLKGFHFYDLFLIDTTRQQIVYSVYKELDFATSLKDGPYANSNLAATVRKVLKHPEAGVVQISDFAPYEPSLAAPAAFLAAPVLKGTELIGIIAAQIPIVEINNILTNEKKWQADGLGDTGEVYIVGFDKLMRSDSRFSLQTKAAEETESDNKKKQEDPTAEKNQSSILRQRVDNVAVTDALRGNTGIINTTGYMGYKVLSSYAPLDIPGLDWAIVAEKSSKEAKQALTKMEKALLTGASITAAIMTLYALLVSNVFVGPLQSILTYVEKLNRGEKSEPLASKRRDEFGQLTHAINDVALKLESEQEKNKQQQQLLKERLLMIFPPAIAEKFDEGETAIGDKFQNVAVTFLMLSGVNEATADMTAHESISLFNQLIGNIDEAAQNNGLDKITSQGNLYLAASGLMNPRLDYARMAVAFAEEVMLAIQRFNIAQGSSVSARIGISSGEVIAGVIGKKKPIYNLMGDTVTTANILAERCAKNSIRVDAPVYNQLLEPDGFNSCDMIRHAHVGEIANWENTVDTRLDREA